MFPNSLWSDVQSQLARPETITVLAGAVLLVCSLLAILKGSIIIPLLLIFGIAGTLFFLQYPRISFAIIIAIRIIIDLFGWLPFRLGPLNVFAVFTGGATILALILFLSRFRGDIEKHPSIHLFLWFTLIISIGAIRAINTKIMFDEFFRLFSPPLMLFLGSSLLYKKGDAKKILLLIMLVGLIPISFSLFHWLTGQMDTYYLNGQYRLLGGYQNLRNHALMMLLFSCCGVYYFFQSKSLSQKFWCSIYCILTTTFMYLTYTRATLLVFACFLVFFFYFTKRKNLMYGCFVLGILIIGLNQSIQERFKDLILVLSLVSEQSLDPRMVASLGSGRYGLWSNSLNAYMDSSLPDILLGSGCGAHWLFTRSAYSGFISVQGGFVDTHNDLLRILYQVGPIALFLFVAMAVTSGLHGARLAARVKDSTYRDIGGLIAALTIAILLNNCISNGINSRITVGWCYWVICSAGFALSRQLAEEQSETKPPLDESKILHLPQRRNAYPRS